MRGLGLLTKGTIKEKLSGGGGGGGGAIEIAYDVIWINALA